MTIEQLAAEMGVSTRDVCGFVACLSVWVRKGYTFEQAIERHMAQMTRLANNSLNPALKPLVIAAFHP